MAPRRKKQKAVKKPSKKSAKKPKKMTAKPIELYYWPTPNGWKISIALEEMKLPYVLKPVNIGKGEQFEPAFLKISPNNRMPAIVDPDGPGGRPISVFESGAILQYLGRKSGKLYPADERGKVQVEEWLFWQVGGLGPMAGQAFHFLNYSNEDVSYAKKRYADEVHRLFGVMNKRLESRKFLAGAYSIADIACWGWVVAAMNFQKLDEFPHLKAWQERMAARPAVKKGFELGAELRKPMTEEQKKVLFNQRAR
jgi:GSH-dependent disulfide-bond oxidoreductase